MIQLQIIRKEQHADYAIRKSSISRYLFWPIWQPCCIPTPARDTRNRVRKYEAPVYYMKQRKFYDDYDCIRARSPFLFSPEENQQHRIPKITLECLKTLWLFLAWIDEVKQWFQIIFWITLTTIKIFLMATKDKKMTYKFWHHLDRKSSIWIHYLSCTFNFF